MALKIITDHKWKPFKYRYEVPKRVLDTDFYWLDEEGAYDGFVCYRGRWYHTSDFLRLPKDGELSTLGYHGYHWDSYFSGILIKLSDDGEAYKIATYIS